MTLACRTVLDLRSPVDKYICQTLLLAASWHRHCAGHSRLEVSTVGGSSPLLARFLEGIGVRQASIAPSPNDDFSKSSNKIEAAHADPEGRVLLVDNDVCFLGGIDELARFPERGIAAAVAGSPRVTDAQWNSIGAQLGLPLLRRRFTPINDRPLVPAPAGGDGEGSGPEAFLYLNSGVVLFPAGHDHRASWRTHQRRIYEHFREHPLKSGAVTSSDQAGFATSVAAHGEFTWLPLRFNYRHGCFRLGLEPPDRIRIMHFTGDVPTGPAAGLAQRAHAYWQKFILPKVEAIPASMATEKARRRDTALAVLAHVLDIIREYDLEHWLAAYRAGSQAAPSP